MAKEEAKTVKMRFKEDKFVDGECVYDANKVYEIAEASVARWLKRGGEIVLDGKGSDDKIEAELDAGLATELEKEGKGTPDETEEAVKKAAKARASDKAKSKSK